MLLDDLETPTPVIDPDRVDHNFRVMQDYCDAHGIALRPHIKTHKIPLLAQKQVALGAVGITCQKLGEAEVMAEAGITDILISYPLIGAAKQARLVALARRGCTLTVAADSVAAVDTVLAAAREAETPIGIYVEFDSGGMRTGVRTPEEAAALVAHIQAAGGPGFYKGVMTYPITDRTGPFLTTFRALADQHGFAVGVVSGGGTPEYRGAHLVPGLTEYRVGTYTYHDRATVAAGAATLDDVAMVVLATVVSRPEDGLAVLDCGSKTLSSDRVSPAAGEGHGVILDYPDAVIIRLNEEHGIVDLSRCDRKPQIGERVRIVPNHVCVVTNLHDSIPVVRNGAVVDTWQIAARGCTR